ncbi:unnamed protein product [Rhizophagus irregularis]|nr:unnamed protein product [Rhizophagus irregularis]
MRLKSPEVLKGKPYTQASDIYSFDNRPKATEILKFIRLFIDSYKYDSQNLHHEISKQFKEAEEYRRSHPASFDKSTTLAHPQAIYKSRLLNPFTKNLPKYDDNIYSNTIEVIDFTKLSIKDDTNE